MIKKLSHVCLKSNDLNLVKKFYIDILGLKISHEFKNKNDEVYGFFLKAGSNTYIEFFNSLVKIKKKDNKFQHICFETNNIKKLFNKIKALDKNCKLVFGKTDNILQFKTKDFENNLIEFHHR